jgi:transcriptional regulator GlxA family with amidase domain
MTPTLYLQAIRLKVAKALLTDNSLSVKQVKAAVGIQSDSYFTHRFKNTYGQTPSHLRSIQISQSTSPIDDAQDSPARSF